ncbi:MAG: GGDEF domain-containing protein, partial [Chlorobiaceae bacterium]
ELIIANKELLFQNEEKEKRAAELIIAMHDYLTGLPNRRLLSERLSLTLALCRRNNAMAALLIFDLDNFKTVNDTLGHAVGDTLLQEVAARSAATLKRSTDSISRLGGDEFVILLPQIVAVSDAVAIAEKIRNNIKEPYNIEGHTINISCSIGIAVYPDHGEDELTLMKHADEAMYRAKNQGRDKVTVFETMSISLLPLLS